MATIQFTKMVPPVPPNTKIQEQLTEEAVHAIDLLNKINIAVNANQAQSFAWFKGIDVYPDPENVLEFADELQEYVKFTGKKSIWDETLLTGDYIKWDYWAQESRPDKEILPGSLIVVNNIVDDAFIEDRILSLDANVPGFGEYTFRDGKFTYDDIFITPGPNTPIGGYKQQFETLDVNFAPGSERSRNEVLAWFKGVNLQPTNEVKTKYLKYIQAYLLDPRKQIDVNIDIGIFINKS